MNKVVAYAATANIYPELRVAVTSLLYNNPEVERVHLFLESDEKFADHRIQVHNIRLFEGLGGIKVGSPNWWTNWTYMSMARLMFPMLMPTERSLLYLDVDTIVDKPLTELWDLDLTGYYVGAVREEFISAQRGKDYFNAGVLAMNLDNMRNIQGELIEYISNNWLPYPDQDTINEVCAVKILRLDSKFNYARKLVKYSSDPHIYHYAAEHDVWRTNSKYQKYKEISENAYQG